MAESRSPQLTKLNRPPVASHLLVPLDGSDRSTRALPVAEVLAEQLHVGVSVLDCLVPTYPLAWEEEWAADHVAVLEGQLVEPSVHATEDVVGDILAAAAATPGTIVCLSTHGRTGLSEVVFGSVARQLCLASPSPVLVVGPTARVPDAFETVQVCFDGFPDSALALDTAGEWSHALGATPWITHVIDAVDHFDGSTPSDVPTDVIVFQAAAFLRARGLMSQWDVLHGRDRAQALASWAVAGGTDLLVVGCAARPVVDRLLGTVTTRLLHMAPCPVLVVGPNVAANSPGSNRSVRRSR